MLAIVPPSGVPEQARKEEAEMDEGDDAVADDAGVDDAAKLGSHPWSGSERDYTYEEMLGAWLWQMAEIGMDADLDLKHLGVRSGGTHTMKSHLLSQSVR